MAMTGLEGQVALVSGASRGVGRAYTLALAAAGAQVVALARTADGDPTRPGSLAELSATADAEGTHIFPLACDVSVEANIVAAVAETIARFGRIDTILNNAVWPLGRWPTLAVPEDIWAGIMHSNVRIPYVFMREAVPHMIAGGGGSIINITAAAAGITRPGMPAHDGSLAYGVSKAALERLTTYFAAEYAGANIAANAISPGVVARYIAGGREPDRRFWGEPVVHLAQQRAADGMTGRIVHTYGYGREWGPAPDGPPPWDDAIMGLLKDAGIVP